MFLKTYLMQAQCLKGGYFLSRDFAFNLEQVSINGTTFNLALNCECLLQFSANYEIRKKYKVSITPIPRDSKLARKCVSLLKYMQMYYKVEIFKWFEKNYYTYYLN